MRIVSKDSNNMYPVCKTTIYIPCDDFKIHEILVSLTEKFHFSVSRSDIFDWSHDWSTIQFSQFTGQFSVKPMLPIPHPTHIHSRMLLHAILCLSGQGRCLDITINANSSQHYGHGVGTQ